MDPSRYNVLSMITLMLTFVCSVSENHSSGILKFTTLVPQGDEI